MFKVETVHEKKYVLRSSFLCLNFMLHECEYSGDTECAIL